ncbi:MULTISPECIES: NlpC/P60 family protein [unclassified Leucobacter]|uniref:NlpC/P60 family protein n=1 Tax=unclassified Leucobacter TaxID=2621730 RepID=UPI00165DC018|nr:MULTISPECIES: NlpC/P60 family protein [unclassified Leucobacter]MBC9928644.1 C40 family peptidase [Leucobacter sp. cx-169]
MAQTPGTELVTRQSISTIGSKLKKGTRVAAGVALSAGLAATFAMPAYATQTVEGAPDLVPAQQLTTVDVDTAVAIELPQATTADEIAAEQRKVAEAEAAKAAEEKAAKAAEAVANGGGAGGADLPSGSGASGLLGAAYAQLGANQDCTVLLERALRAIGFGAGDLGTAVGEYTRYGSVVTSGGYAPGDILIWPGQHVAIYAGNGMAVHSGYSGNQTVVAGAWSPNASPVVVRIG